MLNAEAVATNAVDEIRLEALLAGLRHLCLTQPPDKYLSILEQFVENARKSVAMTPDPRERERLREQYRRVIEFAVDIISKPPN